MNTACAELGYQTAMQFDFSVRGKAVFNFLEAIYGNLAYSIFPQQC
jgi:hypothetical protein